MELVFLVDVSKATTLGDIEAVKDLLVEVTKVLGDDARVSIVLSGVKPDTENNKFAQLSETVHSKTIGVIESITKGTGVRDFSRAIEMIGRAVPEFNQKAKEGEKDRMIIAISGEDFPNDVENNNNDAFYVLRDWVEKNGVKAYFVGVGSRFNQTDIETRIIGDDRSVAIVPDKKSIPETFADINDVFASLKSKDKY